MKMRISLFRFLLCDNTGISTILRMGLPGAVISEVDAPDSAPAPATGRGELRPAGNGARLDGARDGSIGR